MYFFDNLKMYNISWSFRRLFVPVKKSDLVLEVGSGGNPYFRSNILIDAYQETRERHWVPLIADRPTVLGFVENLPFKDNQFDFVIASHVLEHSHDPQKFLSELQRVAKAGYIEVPDAFMERINPYLDHRSEITVRDGVLIIRKKAKSEIDSELVELYSNKVKQILTSVTMPNFPYHFHVRYYWENKINFQIINPDVDATWPAPESQSYKNIQNFKSKLNSNILSIIRKLFSQNSRNQKLSIFDFIVCPICKNNLDKSNDLHCPKCDKHFIIYNEIPNLTVK
jgi:SAM-dependent methyltransferase